MGFPAIAKRIASVFYTFGGKQLIVILWSQLLYTGFELGGLALLFWVMNGIISQSALLQLPFFSVAFTPLQAVILLTLFYMIKLIYGLFHQHLVNRFCFQTNYKLTANLIHHYYRQPAYIFKHTALAETLNKIFTIGGFFTETVLQNVLMLMQELILSVLILLALLLYNGQIVVWFILILTPFLTILILFKTRYFRHLKKEILDENVRFHASVMTLIQGITDIKLSGKFDYFFREFDQKIKKVHDTKKGLQFENGFTQKSLEFISVFSILVLFLLHSVLDQNQRLPVYLAAFATAAFRFIPSVNRILSALQQIQINKPYILYASGVPGISKVTREPMQTGTTVIRQIELENIGFSYTDTPVLKDINVCFNSGKLYGLTGKSGSGKSTLLSVITGIIEPGHGQLRVNGIPVSERDKNVLIHKSAVVLQEPYFINAGFAENVSFGDENPDTERIAECLKDAELSERATRASSENQSRIGDNGFALSGGEKQRLAIARALYRNAGVLILDEPTQALDPVNKQKILSLLKTLTYNRNLITLIVSHDAEVLEACDIRFKMEAGTLTQWP